MNHQPCFARKYLHVALLGIGVATMPFAAHAAIVTIVNADAPGVGLNDPTPRAPEGGNPGATLGAQRLIALQHVADNWGAKLESTVPITISVSFQDAGFTCAVNPDDFVYLAYSGPTAYYQGNPPYPAHPYVYPVALRNAIVGAEADPSMPNITARFNARFDSTPGCLPGYDGFWYGIDPTLAPPGGSSKLSIVSLATHEFAHGLGFINNVNLQNGSAFPPYYYVWSDWLYDLQMGLRWQDMSDAQRAASATNDPNLVWSGPNVTGAQSVHLRPPYRLKVGATAQAGEVKQAYFGDLVPRSGLAGLGAVVNDGSANPEEGCNPLVNPAAIQGRLAVVKRGTCAFGTKAHNAEQAGAIGVLILNNRAEAPSDPLPTAAAADFTLRVPTVTVAWQTGLDLLATLGSAPDTPVGIELVPGAIDIGANDGYVRMFAPETLQVSSSVSHFTDESNAPLLMMSSVTGASFDRTDMTEDLLRDAGWQLAPGVGNTIFTNGLEIDPLH